MKILKSRCIKGLLSVLLAVGLLIPAIPVQAAAPEGETIEIFNSGETGPSGGGADLTNEEDDAFTPVSFADPSTAATSAQLVIYGFDVDAPDEIDKVFINDKEVGILSGMNNEWNTTILDVTGDALASLNDGKPNKIRMETNDGWIVYIRSMNLIINGGSEAKAFDKTQMDVTASLSGDTITTTVKVASTTGGTFHVEYAIKELDNNDQPVTQVASKDLPAVVFAPSTVTTERQTFQLPTIPAEGQRFRVDYIIKNNLQIPVLTLSAFIGDKALPVIPNVANTTIVGGEILSKDMVVVSGLDELKETLADKTPGYSTALDFSLTENPNADHSDKIKEKINRDGKKLGVVLDIDIMKTVRDSSGNVVAESTGLVSETPSLIGIEITLPKDLQGMKEYFVYRYHDGKVDMITVEPNENGEMIVLSEDGSTLTVFACRFSTYVVGYAPAPASSTTNPPLDDEPHMGGRVGNSWALLVGMGLCVVSIGIYSVHKAKKDVE